VGINESAEDNSHRNREAQNVVYFHIPHLLDDQLNANVENQNISRRFQNRFASYCVTEQTRGKAHRENPNCHAEHHHPDFIG
jgi:hypothetical protein